MPFGIDEALLAGGFASNLFGGDSEEEKQGKINNRISNAEYEARLPIRQLALNRLTGPQAQRENLNSLFAADAGNPYSVPMERPPVLPGMGGGGMPSGGGMGSRGTALYPPSMGGPGAELPVGDQYANTIRPELPGVMAGEKRQGLIDRMVGKGITPNDGSFWGGIVGLTQQEQTRRGR